MPVDLVPFARIGYKQTSAYGELAELADALDLKSSVSNNVRVRVPYSLPLSNIHSAGYITERKDTL